MPPTSAEFQDLTQAVTDAKTVEDSAIAAFAGLADKIDEAAGDKAASVALAQQVRDESAALAAAIPANTPAAGAP